MRWSRSTERAEPGSRRSPPKSPSAWAYFDWQRLRDQVLVPLASGSAARYQRYDWPTGQVAAGKLYQAPRSPGRASSSSRAYTARPELAGYYDLTIWVETPREVCMHRLDVRAHATAPVTGMSAGVQLRRTISRSPSLTPGWT